MSYFGWCHKLFCAKIFKKLAVPVLAGVALLLGSNVASAGVTCNSGNFAATLNIAIPNPISVARDYSGGIQAISAWVNSPLASTTCTYSADGSLVRFTTGVAVAPSVSLQSVGTLDGYSVYKTSLNNVGVQIVQQYNLGNCTASTWSNYPGSIFSRYPAQYPNMGAACSETANKSGTYSMQVRARLVQLGPVASGAVDQYVLGTFTMVRTATGTPNGTENTYPLTTISGFPVSSIVLNSVQIAAPTCTVSVNDVELKTVMWSGFASTATLANTPFQFNLTGCPSGMTNFTYRIDPVTTAIDPANGVFANSTGTGMAQGVGLRLTDSTGSAAVRLDGTNYTVSNYSSSAGGTASIPMYVSYFRTGTAAQVTGGMVRGTAQLTLYYR